MNIIASALRFVLPICLLLAAAFAHAAPKPMPAPPAVGAESFILTEFHSGKVLAEQDADQRVEPASLTKLMTSYIAFQELKAGNISLDDKVTVSEKAWRMPGSRMFIEVGTKVSVEALLKGIIVQSGNDASVALAEYISGTEKAFAAEMNRAADALGMSNTHYVNATGLPAEKHYTSARDTARLTRALIREFPDYYRWYAIKQYTYNDIKQYNRNSLLWRSDDVDGVKTGHTEEAGYCLAASAARDPMRLISVVMGADSEEARADESQTLLNFGFRFYETHRLYAAGEPLTEARVWKGARQQVALGLDEDLYVTIPRGRYDALEAKMKIEPNLMAPVATAQQVGSVRVALDGQLVAQEPLYPLRKVAEGSLWQRMLDELRLVFQ